MTWRMYIVGGRLGGRLVTLDQFVAKACDAGCRYVRTTWPENGRGVAEAFDVEHGRLLLFAVQQLDDEPLPTASSIPGATPGAGSIPEARPLRTEVVGNHPPADHLGALPAQPTEGTTP